MDASGGQSNNKSSVEAHHGRTTFESQTARRVPTASRVRMNSASSTAICFVPVLATGAADCFAIFVCDKLWTRFLVEKVVELW